MVWLALVAAVIHGLGYAALAAVVGGLALDQLILPAGVSELASVRARLRRLITGCTVVLVLTTMGDVVVRAQVLSGVTLPGVAAVLPDVLARTHFGAVWLARSALLVLAVVLSLARAAPLRTLCLVVALGLAPTTSLTGQAAEWGDLTVSVAADWAHAVAACVWTGGIVGLVFVMPLARQGPPNLLGLVATRFSRLAGGCLLVVVVTGTYNAWAQLGTVSALWTSTYGRILAVKLLLVAALVWLGAVNRYVILPLLGADHVSRGVGARLFRVSRLVVVGRSAASPGRSRPHASPRTSRGEAVVALAVFACTAALGEATPGRHAEPERMAKPHLGVSALRRSPGVPSSGTVLPPSGDAARGRAVFVRLECFACHTVRGEALPTPRQPGPDLTAVGRHHPGYLVESIMNPNAMIVDGEGYTDAGGSSTMPDYRERLTVGELIDLVAYLKTLGEQRTTGPASRTDAPRGP